MPLPPLPDRDAVARHQRARQRTTMLSHVLQRALDTLMPPRCLACGDTTWTPDSLCAACWATLRFIDRPFCDGCGLPLDCGAADEDLLCGGCTAAHPPFARARAALVYGEGSSRLILGYKNGDRTDAVPVFSRWMVRAGRELLADADLLVPVPLHWTRLLVRRFNQSALLAYAIRRQTGLRVVPDAIIRRRRTAKMGTLGASARARSVAGAFAMRTRSMPLIEGRRVVLIDDVLTTGATVAGCARVLLAAGAASVDVLALARATRDLTVQL